MAAAPGGCASLAFALAVRGTDGTLSVHARRLGTGKAHRAQRDAGRPVEMARGDQLVQQRVHSGLVALAPDVILSTGDSTVPLLQSLKVRVMVPSLAPKHVTLVLAIEAVSTAG